MNKVYSISMRKRESFYQVLFHKTTAFSITLVCVIFLNILNLPALMPSEYAVSADKYVMQIENKIGKIYNVVNLPVHIMNEIFKNDMSFSGAAGNEQDSDDKFAYALFIPAKKNTKKSGEVSPLNAVIPSGGNFDKLIPPDKLLLSGILSKYGRCRLKLESNDAVRYMLLFLMLLLVLPRGIPVKIQNIKNIINFAFPVFILNKVGNFRFITEECKGSVK